MTIADAVVEMIENKLTKDLMFCEEGKIIIVPRLDSDFCHNAIEYAGKKHSKHEYWQQRFLECDRVANALEKDSRFYKFIHDTGRKAFEYLLTD